MATCRRRRSRLSAFSQTEGSIRSAGVKNSPRTRFCTDRMPVADGPAPPSAAFNVLEGRREHSPAFQRWEPGSGFRGSPVGMAELHPSLLDYQLGARGSPSVETLGYCRIVPTGRTAPCSRTWAPSWRAPVDSFARSIRVEAGYLGGRSFPNLSTSQPHSGQVQPPHIRCVQVPRPGFLLPRGSPHLGHGLARTWAFIADTF